MQVESFLEKTAGRLPDKTAVICGQGRWTYAELQTLSNRLAHALIELGVAPGDRVAIHLPNSYEAVVAIFAVLKAGAAIMMINPTTKASKLRYLLDHSRASAIVLPGGRVGGLRECLKDSAHLRTLITSGLRPPEKPSSSRAIQIVTAMEDLLERHQDDTQPPARRAIDLDLGALLYTSGSTGHPKGVMLTHANMVAAAESVTTYLGLCEDDIILSVLPLSFGYGLYQALMSVKMGGTVILEQSMAYPQAILNRLVDEKVTCLPLVPTTVGVLLRMDLSKADLSSLRIITSAAAALPVEHIRKLRQTLPHVRIFSMYGQTECKRISYLDPELVDRLPRSVGKGMPNQQTYLVDEHGKPVAPGEVGELVVRGSHVMAGYWDQPEETAAKLRPGPLPGQRVLYTGDLFRQDEQGYLYFVSRKDDIIMSRGEKVAPLEVENVLYRHADIDEAAVFGIADELLGEAIKAVVVLAEGAELTERELLRYCASQLEDFMVPHHVEFRTELPKSSNGKINKLELAGVAK